ncbi:MAG: hypothetical protein OHK0029_09480 [Armatimonadaceae bacterium]
MSDETYEPTPWDRVAPVLYNIGSGVMTVAFIAAGLAAAYLLYGIFSGQMANVASLPQADQQRVSGVIQTAGQIMTVGLALGTLALAGVLLIEETTGYIILVAAIVVGFGVQFAYQTFGGTISSDAMRQAFAAFQNASYIPMAIGGLLVARDVVMRFISALSGKGVDQEELTFGSEAQAERKPIRTSLFARCFEGPYCRESIRVHCPIFQAKRACWKELRGCYCEEDIVMEAARRSQATPLQMAPDAKYNFANAPTPGLSAVGSGQGKTNADGSIASGGGPMILSISSRGMETEEDLARPTRQVLTDAQKRDRCKSCVIYNEHLREKYKILMPVVLIGGIALCVVLAPAMRDALHWGFTGMERLASQIALKSGPGPQFTRPPSAIEWTLVGAFSLMIVSKMLQTLEWMCFKAKI